MEDLNRNEMESMNIKKLALKISTPMVISMIAIALYGIVDTIFISKISRDALTAVTLTIPVQSFITAIALGIGIGVNSILAKTLGQKDEKKALQIIIHGILITFICWFIIICCSFCVRKFFEIFTDNIEVRKLGYDYLLIITVLSLGNLFEILFEKILEAYGKAKESMILQISGAIINLILDPILIFGLFGFPGLGIKGAAISTIIGQVSGMILGLFIILRNKIIVLKSLYIKLDLEIISKIFKVGFPTFILETLTSIVTLILNKILITFSEATVSLWGIYYQLQKFVFIVIYGLNYGMIPILAYNWGAKKKDRIKEIIKYFLKLSSIITIIGMIIFFVFPKQLILFYNVNDEILNLGVVAFRILSLSFVFAGISLIFSSVFQAFGNGIYSLLISLFRKVVIVLPIIFIFKDMFGIYSIWLGFLIAEIITCIISTILFRKIKKEIIDKIN